MFALKLIRQKLNTKSRLKKLEIDINGDFPFCNRLKKDIDHLFKNHVLIKTVWATVNTLCPSPNALNCSFMDWIDKIWNIKMWYNKLFYKPLGKMFTLLELYEI